VPRPQLDYFGTDPVAEAGILAMVLPHHREVVAAWGLHRLAGIVDQEFRGAAALLPMLAEAAGPIGPAMTLVLAYGCGARHETDRGAAVDAVLTLAAREEAFAAALGADLGDLGGDGTVKLNRVALTLADAHRAGASAAVWAILAAAIPPLLSKAPRGLPDLLELASRVATEVGASDEIPRLGEVADRAGSTRLVKEARRLRALLRA
jgi:hypothetical protein